MERKDKDSGSEMNNQAFFFHLAHSPPQPLFSDERITVAMAEKYVWPHCLSPYRGYHIVIDIQTYRDVHAACIQQILATG